MVSVVAVEGGNDVGNLLCPQQLLHQLTDTVLVGSVVGVDSLDQPSGSDQLFEDRPVSNVGKVRVSAFLICHRAPYSTTISYFSTSISTVPSQEKLMDLASSGV